MFAIFNTSSHLWKLRTFMRLITRFMSSSARRVKSENELCTQVHVCVHARVYVCMSVCGWLCILYHACCQ